MNNYQIVKYHPPTTTRPEKYIETRAVIALAETNMRLVFATVLISLGLFIYVVIRGDTTQMTIFLPFVAGMLQLLLRNSQR